MLLGIFIFITAIFNIAANSIGIQCYGTNPNTGNPNSYNFLVFNLVMSILLVLIAVGGLYAHIL